MKKKLILIELKKKTIKICRELPELSDRENGRRMRKEKGTSRLGEQSDSLSGSDWRIDNTLLTGGRRHAYVFGRGVG